MMRFGYPCVSRLLGRSTNHECTLRLATPERLRGLIAQNLQDLRLIVQHNLQNGWLLFRIGSSVIPFGSHPVNQVPWWREFRSDLDAIGAFARANGLRLSFHPGQYTILNAPDSAVIARAIEEIAYSARFLDELGLDASHKIVIHLGGVYGDKPAAMARFIETARTLDSGLRDRLVIENDERSYTPADALTVAAQTGLPVVFDNLHYQTNPGPGDLDTLLARVFDTWKASDGPPKVHFSSQAPGGCTGNHADTADPQEFADWTARWAQHGTFDLMLEAKAKDLALQQLLSVERE